MKLRWDWDEMKLRWDEIEIRLRWDEIEMRWNWDEMSWDWDEMKLRWDEIEMRLRWDEIEMRLRWDEDQIEMRWDWYEMRLDWDEMQLRWDEIRLRWDPSDAGHVMRKVFQWHCVNYFMSKVVSFMNTNIFQCIRIFNKCLGMYRNELADSKFTVIGISVMMNDAAVVCDSHYPLNISFRLLFCRVSMVVDRLRLIDIPSNF